MLNGFLNHSYDDNSDYYCSPLEYPDYWEYDKPHSSLVGKRIPMGQNVHSSSDTAGEKNILVALETATVVSQDDRVICHIHEFIYRMDDTFSAFGPLVACGL